MIREQVADYLKGVRLTTKVDKNDVAFFIRYPVSSENMAEAIVGLLCAEIEKMGLSEEEIRQATRITQTAIATPGGYSLSAQAQLQKILNKLKEGAE